MARKPNRRERAALALMDTLRDVPGGLTWRSVLAALTEAELLTAGRRGRYGEREALSELTGFLRDVAVPVDGSAKPVDPRLTPERAATLLLLVCQAAVYQATEATHAAERYVAALDSLRAIATDD